MAELEAYIVDQLKDCLYNEIGDEIDHTIQRHAESDVYSYSPKSYKRRGLLRSGNYYYHIPNGLSLTVADQTPGNTPIGNGHAPTGTQLSEIISSGAQGNGHGKWKDAFPRPYIENAQKEIGGRVVQILKARFG